MMPVKYHGLGALLLICLFTVFAGCIEGPTSPISSIPTILMDYIEETEETKIYVQGVEDHLYSNITIQINEQSITENNTYALHMVTTFESFDLNVTVWDKQKQYEYIGNITIVHDNDEVKLEIVDADHEEPNEVSLPHKIIMERKE